MRPRPVIDGELGHAEAAVVGEHRDEAVQLAVELQPAHDVGAVGLQAAVHVVQPEAGDAAGDRVEDPGESPAPPRVAPVRLPARYQVETLVELRQQARDLRRVVLEVAVDRDDGVALRVGESDGERGRLAEIAAQADDLHVRLAVVQPRERREGAVLRAVVDEDSLPGLVGGVERSLELVVEASDAALLVVNRDDDRDHGREVSRAEAAGEETAAAEVAAEVAAEAAVGEGAAAVEAEAAAGEEEAGGEGEAEGRWCVA